MEIKWLKHIYLWMKLTIVDKNYCQKEEINFLKKGVFFNEYF